MQLQDVEFFLSFYQSLKGKSKQIVDRIIWGNKNPNFTHYYESQKTIALKKGCSRKHVNAVMKKLTDLKFMKKTPFKKGYSWKIEPWILKLVMAKSAEWNWEKRLHQNPPLSNGNDPKKVTQGSIYIREGTQRPSASVDDKVIKRSIRLGIRLVDFERICNKHGTCPEMIEKALTHLETKWKNPKSKEAALYYLMSHPKAMGKQRHDKLLVKRQVNNLQRLAEKYKGLIAYCGTVKWHSDGVSLCLFNGQERKYSVGTEAFEDLDDLLSDWFNQGTVRFYQENEIGYWATYKTRAGGIYGGI